MPVNAGVGALLNSKPAFVQIMVWRQTGVKPLFEPLMAKFIDVYMRHPASMS